MMVRVKSKLRTWLGSVLNDDASFLQRPERIEAILDRERLRADRGNSNFAVLTLTFDSQPKEAEFAKLGRVLSKRLRATDDAGRLDNKRVAIVLPETPIEGAWKVSEDIGDLLHGVMPLPKSDVYVYPLQPSQSQNKPEKDDRNSQNGHTHDRPVAQPVHALYDPPLPVWKRAIDVVGAATALMLISPLLLVTAILTYWQSGAPILFQHERIGRHGRRFKVWKFRTMVPNAEQVLNDYLAANPLAREEWARDHKLRDDPRVTKIGKFLRKASIDELPQLWNVLKGEMSLVGPRPIVTAEIDKYGRYFKPYCSVLPGLTGLWQVSGRNETTYARRVELDSYYARNWSLGLDLYILVMTVRVVLLRQGAY